MGSSSYLPALGLPGTSLSELTTGCHRMADLRLRKASLWFTRRFWEQSVMVERGDRVTSRTDLRQHLLRQLW